jgi:hypothetical protein
MSSRHCTAGAGILKDFNVKITVLFLFLPVSTRRDRVEITERSYSENDEMRLGGRGRRKWEMW